LNPLGIVYSLESFVILFKITIFVEQKQHNLLKQYQHEIKISRIHFAYSNALTFRSVETGG